MIKVYNNRIVSPSEFKISNKFENDTQTIQFDLKDVKTKGNVYLICKYEKDNEYKQPLLLDENNSIPVKTFLSSKPGKYISVLAISNVLIDNDYNFSDDNIMFISNQFEMNVEDNFLSGSSIEWDLSPEMKIKFDELIALVEKVQSDLEAGAFNGVGIKSIEKVSSQGLIDNYKITFTDKSIFEYQVTNGKDGEMPTITIVDGKWNVNGIDTGQRAQGEDGLSAYEVAVKNGFEGSEQDWLESLKYQSSPEFNQLAEQVRADAETTTQNKKEIEKLVSDFNTNYDTKLKEFNDNAESKNEEFNTNVQSANTIIDGKVTEAAAQAEKAKEEADRATQATDGKLDKNQGAENSDKILTVDSDGNVITKSKEDLGIIAKNDNFLYKDVAKQLNPNITDSFQRAMWNLKLYGQSTQGADPSPTNKQDITAISKFDGIIIGNNYLQGLELGSFDNNGVYQPSTGACVNTNRFIRVKQGVQYRFSSDGQYYIIAGCFYDENKNFLRIDQTGNPTPREGEVYLNFVVLGASKVNALNQLEENSITPYTPYVAQPFTYTPTQNMYSTRDGSIADYVDVENGVEVYNMKKYVVTGEEMFLNDYVASGFYGRYFNMENGNGVLTDKIFCNYLPYVKGVWSKSQIGACQNARIQIHLKFSNETLGITDDTPVEEKRTAFANYLKQLYASENPLYVVVVVTPTETPIDPEQLQMLRALYTYMGVTNFLCNAPVSFTYERSLQIVINNLENAINQTNASILLGGNN